MVTIRKGTPERLGRDGIWCDPCLVPLIEALNNGGLPTSASCCGHLEPGRLGWVMLKDGRVLIIAPDLDAAHRITDVYDPLTQEAETCHICTVLDEHTDEPGMGLDFLASTVLPGANDEALVTQHYWSAEDLRAVVTPEVLARVGRQLLEAQPIEDGYAPGGPIGDDR